MYHVHVAERAPYIIGTRRRAEAEAARSLGYDVAVAFAGDDVTVSVFGVLSLF